MTVSKTGPLPPEFWSMTGLRQCEARVVSACFKVAPRYLLNSKFLHCGDLAWNTKWYVIDGPTSTSTRVGTFHRPAVLTYFLLHDGLRGAGPPYATALMLLKRCSSSLARFRYCCR